MGFFGDALQALKRYGLNPLGGLNLASDLMGDANRSKVATAQYPLDPRLYQLPGAEQLRQQFGGQTGTSLNAFNQQGQNLRHIFGDILQGGRSVATEQLRQAAGRNIGQQQGLAASARPGQQALAARMASQQGGAIASGLAGQAAQAQLAERQMAAQALAGLRGQDLQSALGFGGLNLRTALGQLQGGIAQGRDASSRFGAMLGVPTEQEQLLSMIASAAPLAAAALSDRRVKTRIRPGGKEVEKFLETLKPFRYLYKNEKHGKGEQLSVMAQDLERGPGKDAVFETPEGKAVNYAKLLPKVVASLGHLHGRLSKLEGRK